jgi:nucleotide-binding universal stress UspA family protein
VAKIVVGVDGSAAGAAALTFAVDEARLRNATLHVLHASEAPEWAGTPGGYVVVGEPSESHDLSGTEQAHADAAVQALEAQAAGVDTSGIDVRLEPVLGDAASALLEASNDADLVVVGSRGRSGVRGLVLGSVSRKVAQHASCPVVIVRADT